MHLFNGDEQLKKYIEQISKDNVIKYMYKFEELIGVSKIKLIHLNNSKNILGAKVDRHENLEEGYIGYEGLKQIILLFSKLEVPLVLETPDKKIIEDIKYNGL